MSRLTNAEQFLSQTQHSTKKFIRHPFGKLLVFGIFLWSPVFRNSFFDHCIFDVMSFEMLLFRNVDFSRLVFFEIFLFEIRTSYRSRGRAVRYKSSPSENPERGGFNPNTAT
jgi:hypothetical protein